MLQLLRRTADWLEKMSVAAMAVGVFQARLDGMGIALACYLGSLWLTREVESILRMAGEN